ncbi:MAG: ATP-dependent helicase, partial [Patescibacteria group bacterium]
MSDIVEGLNPSQLQAVTHASGPLLIVAGAGTGKTTVLARRYAWLMQERSLRSDQILALTFTEKAAGEMEDRVLQLLPNGTYDFWISTFHGFCQRVLEERALEIGLPNRFRIVTETDAWLLLKRRMNELPLDHYRPLGNPVKFLNGLLKHFSRAKDEGVTPEQYLAFATDAVLDTDADPSGSERTRLLELANCYIAYQRILREEGALDFGDLIVETLRLLRERPAVLAEFRERFRIVMVDEFQDTNWAQYELVKLLAGPERNITVVGDDDQAIYKFRGASLANILQFRDDYPDAVTVALTQNYRSRQEVLDAAYRFIRKNDPNRLEITLGDTGLSKALTSARGGTGGVRAIWYRSLEEEVEAVMRAIADLKRKDAELSWNDVAILVRSNDGALPFVRGLERHGIPFRFFALRGLYAKPVVIDIVSLLTAALAPYESSFLWRAMTVPATGFTGRDIAELVQHAKRKSLALWNALKQVRAMEGSDEGMVRRVETFVAHLEAIAETAKRDRPLAVLQKAMDRTGFLAEVMKRDEAGKVDAIRLLNAFADRIKRYEASTHAPTTKEFLDELRLEIESGEEGGLSADPDEGPELVKVMTVHASKGLEFRHVFLVGAVDQRFPTRERRDAIPLPDGLVNERLPEGDAHLEEERRLMYVAMTRAKDGLTVTGSEDIGGVRKKKPSIFIAEAELTLEMGTVEGGTVLSLAPAEPIREAERDLRDYVAIKRRFSFTQLAAFR